MIDAQGWPWEEAVEECYRLSNYGSPPWYCYIETRALQANDINIVTHALQPNEVVEYTKRRFIIIPCHYINHWTVVIVDQWRREVWHFDAWVQQRQERFDGAMDAWKAHVAPAVGYSGQWIGINAPMTEQQTGHACGWIAAQSVETFLFNRDVARRPVRLPAPGNPFFTANTWTDWTEKLSRAGPTDPVDHYETAVMSLWRTRMLAELGLPAAEPRMTVSRNAVDPLGNLSTAKGKGSGAAKNPVVFSSSEDDDDDDIPARTGSAHSSRHCSPTNYRVTPPWENALPKLPPYVGGLDPAKAAQQKDDRAKRQEAREKRRGN
jgi:hypothetical protein